MPTKRTATEYTPPIAEAMMHLISLNGRLSILAVTKKQRKSMLKFTRNKRSA
jgi:hypothetical protein